MNMAIKKCNLDDLPQLQSISVETFSETFKNSNSPDHLHASLKTAYNLPKLEQEMIQTLE